MPRIRQDKFRIFVSHKHADASVANVVAEELEKIAPQLIDCWVSGQDLTAGLDWNRQIKAALGDSHLLILIFTTPSHTWDWCLYEVGLFMRFDADDVTSVVCLFAPDGATPGPLNQVQGVAAEADSIVNRFLKPLCTQTWRVSDDWQRGALVPDVDPARLRAAAERISASFGSIIAGTDDDATETYTYRPNHSIVLDLSESKCDDTWDSIPKDAKVVQGDDATSSYTLALFKAHQRKGQRSWGELVAQVDGEASLWLRDLDAAFAESLKEHLWAPSQETFEAWHPGTDERRTYLPLLYEISRRHEDGRPIGATIVLVPQERGISEPEPEPQVTASWA